MSHNIVYQYSKITSQGTIRLMQLHPSPDLQAPVHCSIVHETLAKYENSLLEFYISVSYVWGDPNIKSTISVDGRRLEITSSLDTALRHIRDGERMLHVWADGVCIHQDDVEDRNLQVSQMGSIYSTAQHTVIFLGPSSPVCEHLLKLIEPTTPEHQSHASDWEGNSRIPPGSSFEELLDNHILNRPWFTRTWIFQELVLSNDPWVQIGRSRIKWLHFSRYVLSVPESKWTDNFKCLAQMSEARAKIRHINECRDPGNPAKILLDVLSSRRGLGVSDPRDVIYAHLGMISMRTQAFVYSSQPRMSTTSYNEDAMAISYDKTVVQVFENAALFLFQNIPWLSMLLHVEEVEQGERPQGLPSWAPNWTRQWTPKSPQYDNDYYANLPNRQDKKWLNSAIKSGVLAVSGFEFGFVKAVIHDSLLPNLDILPHQSEMVRLVNWIQSPTIASNALEALRILVDYHIERSPEIISNIPWGDFKPPQVPEGLRSFLAPLIEKWETAFPPDGLVQYGVTGNNYTEFLTGVLLDNSSVILSRSIPGEGHVALLDSNYFLQAPSQVQVNDCVGHFIRTQEAIGISCANIILRQEPRKEDLDSDAAIRLSLSSSDNVKHFKYVRFGTSLTCFDIAIDPQHHISTIFAIH